MDPRISIEWQECRGIREYFWVNATKQAGKWVFQDRSQWESRWYNLPASAERIAKAEALTSGARSKTSRREEVAWLRASGKAGCPAEGAQCLELENFLLLPAQIGPTRETCDKRQEGHDDIRLSIRGGHSTPCVSDFEDF